MAKTSVQLGIQQQDKLNKLSADLGLSKNAVVNMLIDNARLEPITRYEAVADLPQRPVAASAAKDGPKVGTRRNTAQQAIRAKQLSAGS